MGTFPAAIIRIALRYGAAALVARGILLPGDGAELAADPQVIDAIQIAAGLAMAGVAEVWYWLAKRFGWGT